MNLTQCSGTSTITELQESGIILESFAFNPEDNYEKIIEMPLNMNAMQAHALKGRRWGSKKPLSVWDTFAGLPNYQQEMVLEFIAKRKREIYSYSWGSFSPSPQLVLISLNVAKHRWQRFTEALKRLINIDPSDAPTRSTLFIVIARVMESQRGGPEPLISTVTAQRPPSIGGDSIESDTEYSSLSVSYGSRSRSRGRYESRARARRERSRGRTRSRGLKRGLASAAAFALVHAYRRRRETRELEGKTSHRRARARARRSRSRSRYSSGSEYPERRSRADATNTTDVVEHGYYPQSSYYPPPPGTTKPPRNGDQGDYAPQVRRVMALNENDGYRPSSAFPPPPGRRPTVKEGDGIEPMEKPTLQPRRTTTSLGDGDRGTKSVVGTALAALGLRTNTGGERNFRPPRENEIARRNTMVRSSSNTRLSRGDRSRRDRSRSRSRSRVMVLPRRSTRRRSRSGVARTQLYGKSPERPIIRTDTDDGVPPTQRDKAAVAEYYLKKWTTAYDHVRAQNRVRSAKSRVRSRRRSRSYTRRRSQVYEPDLIEYGSNPVYPDGGGPSAYYPPPPAQNYDSNPYSSGPYNPADYYPSPSNNFPPPPSAAAGGAHEERSRGRRPSRSSDDSHNGLKTGRGERGAAAGSAPFVESEQSYYRPPRTMGVVHTVETDDEEDEGNKTLDSPPAALAVPSSQQAYAESVPDTGNGGRGDL